MIRFVHFGCLQSRVTIDGNVVHIDPVILFNRLVLLIKNEEDRIPYFAFELTPEPTSLFKEGRMRKPNKADLRNRILKLESRTSKPIDEYCVIDGGALLNQPAWLPGCTYSQLIDQYLTHLRYKYGKSKLYVVFDGYDDQLSTKTDEHSRRTAGVSIAADVKITNLGMKVTSTKKEFLRNVHNKKQLIQLLRAKFNEHKIETFQSEGDADVLLVETSLNIADEGYSVLQQMTQIF